MIALPFWAGDLFLSDTWGETLYAVLLCEPSQWYLFMSLLGAMICWRCVWALVEPSAGRVQMAVKQGIMSIVLLDAAACFAARGVWWALAVLSLLAPTMVLGMFFKST